MPIKANQNTFDFSYALKHPKKTESYGKVQLDPVDWHDNVTEGMKQVISEGDHMAQLLRRVLAGELCPRLTINNAIDRWENTCAGFEKE